MYLCGKCAETFTIAKDPQAIVLSREIRKSKTIISLSSDDQSNEACESGVEEEIDTTTIVASDSTDGFSHGKFIFINYL